MQGKTAHRRTRLAAAAIALAAAHAGCGDRTPPRAASPTPPLSTSATAGPTEAELRRADGGAGTLTPGALGSGWLRVSGNKILAADGTPFRGRGANVHDTRSCDACAFEPPHVDEVLRRIDELTDGWRATFLRLLLESYPDRGPGRTHFANVLDDEAYFRDVVRMVMHVGRKKGVYVMVSLWQDPTFSELGWPTERTRAVWRKLATALRDVPWVLFGLVNEPKKNDDGRLDAEVWAAMNETVRVIREVERPGQHHLVAVQGTREWGRVLDYYVTHPITAGGGENVVYETHPYNRKARHEALVTRPAKTLPVVIGEFGWLVDKDVTMYEEDAVALMDLAESLDVPWLAWTFHTNCPPNLVEHHAGTCGVGVPLDPSPWGRVVKSRLSRALPSAAGTK